jgi:hypothetical protein
MTRFWTWTGSCWSLAIFTGFTAWFNSMNGDGLLQNVYAMTAMFTGFAWLVLTVVGFDPKLRWWRK